MGSNSWGPTVETATGTQYQNGSPLDSWTYEKSYRFGAYEGAVTPGYYSLRRKRKLIPAQHYSNYVAYSGQKLSSYRIKDTSTGTEYFSPDWLSSYPSRVLVGQDALQAYAGELNPESEITRAIANFYSSGWDGLTFAAELKQTLEMFTQIVPKLIRYIKWASSESAKLKVGFYQFVDGYLEGRFGWRPLFHDIQSIYRLLFGAARGLKQVYKGSANKSDSRSYTLNLNTVGYPGVWGGQFFADVDLSLSIRGSYATSIAPPKVTINPIQTIWEKVKFSFVVDWICNIGNILISWSNLPIGANSTSFWGASIVATTRVELRNVWFAPNWSTSGVVASSQSSESLKLRVPALPDYTPRLNVRLDYKRILDLLALIAQHTR